MSNVGQEIKTTLEQYKDTAVHELLAASEELTVKEWLAQQPLRLRMLNKRLAEVRSKTVDVNLSGILEENPAYVNDDDSSSSFSSSSDNNDEKNNDDDGKTEFLDKDDNWGSNSEDDFQPAEVRRSPRKTQIVAEDNLAIVCDNGR